MTLVSQPPGVQTRPETVAAPIGQPIDTGAPKRRQRRKHGARFWIGILLLVAGVGLGGWWWWDTFGTTIAVQASLQAEIEEFVEQNLEGQGRPEVIVEPEQLITDFDASPPPEIHLGATGTAFGVLTIPSWQGETGIQGELLRNRILLREGGATMAETNRVLNTGAAAHYPETAGPGEIGNFAISAHRRSYGDSFLHLPDLDAGDWVLLETSDAWFIYQVIGDGKVVLPTDVFVLNPDPFNPVGADGMQHPTRRLITLTTCSTANGGAFGNSHRWIVHGELYAWMPRSAGIPPMVDHYWDDSVLAAAS